MQAICVNPDSPRCTMIVSCTKQRTAAMINDFSSCNPRIMEMMPVPICVSALQRDYGLLKDLPFTRMNPDATATFSQPSLGWPFGSSSSIADFRPVISSKNEDMRKNVKVQKKKGESSEITSDTRKKISTLHQSCFSSLVMLILKSLRKRRLRVNEFAYIHAADQSMCL